MKLRDYQEAAIIALYEFLQKKDTNPCLVLPTGSGKTPVMAQICSDAVGRWSGRVLILAHRRELLEQSYEKLGLICPGIKVGIYSAGLKRRNSSDNVIVAGIQSVYRRACELGKFDLIMIDEAHRIPPEGFGMYRRFLDDAKTVNPLVRLIGLTATPYRMGTGPICAPENLLQEVCHEVGVKELIIAGWLCKLISKTGKPESVIDTSDVSIRGGEFVESELEQAFVGDRQKVVSAVKELLEHASGTLPGGRQRNKALIFTCGMIHAGMVREELCAQGVSPEQVAFVCGETPSDDRRELLEGFKHDGSPIRFMVNINVLTEGFDAPNIDLIALMRATKSPGLYYQMVGRGLRQNPGKEDCLVLDFGENILRHGPVDKVRPAKQPNGEGDGEAPCKKCPNCLSMIPTACLECPDCHFVFPVKDKAKHQEKASTAPIISPPKSPVNEWFKVEAVSYHVHVKKDAAPGHPKTLRVDYRTSFFETHSEWICVEHPPGSFPRKKAEQWWKTRMLQTDHGDGSLMETNDPPQTAEEAASWAENEFDTPSEICTRKESGSSYLRIIGYKWAPFSVNDLDSYRGTKKNAWGTDFEPAAEDATFKFGANAEAKEAPQKPQRLEDWIDSMSPEDIPF